MAAFDTPFGPMSYVLAPNGALLGLGFGAHDCDPAQSLELERQILQFFDRERTEFDYPLELRGTPFQRAVWEELLKIPFGETRSYRQIANALGQPAATRAVGAANGANPIALIVPCHRVIGSTGRLTGYAGGLNVKARLLDFESRSLFD